jgi:CDP-6-deoxy-D-xylo-4-hexulose-3-dehydrase
MNISLFSELLILETILWVKKCKCNQFAEYVGAKYAVMSNSGSSANLVMLAAAKYVKNSILNDGDSVIVPAVSWSTTYYPVHQLGLSLNFVDIDLETLNIDINQIIATINNRTKAILVVNLLGNPANLVELQRIAEEHGLLLLEDNCESLGASINGKQAGTFGLAGTYSSFFSHHISTMEGGITTTDDLALYETMKSLRAHGWTRDLPESNNVFNKTGDLWDDLFRFVLPGYNLRPLELEGALGQEQLKKLNGFIQTRRANAQYLMSQVNNFPRIRLQKENGESSWFGFSLLLTEELRGKRKELLRLLAKADIQSRPIVAGNFTLNPVMKHLRHEALPDTPNATRVHNDGLFVGNHHYDLKTRLDRLVDVLVEFEENYG